MFAGATSKNPPSNSGGIDTGDQPSLVPSQGSPKAATADPEDPSLQCGQGSPKDSSTDFEDATLQCGQGSPNAAPTDAEDPSLLDSSKKGASTETISNCNNTLCDYVLSVIYFNFVFVECCFLCICGMCLINFGHL